MLSATRKHGPGGIRGEGGVNPHKYLECIVPYLSDIKEMYSNGMTIREICKVMQVSERSFHYWRSKHEELRAILREASIAASYRVEGSLFQKAVGYEYDELTYETHQEEDSATGKMRSVENLVRRVTKHVQPDMKAIAFWLCNRASKRWANITALTADINVKHSATLAEAVRELGAQERQALAAPGSAAVRRLTGAADHGNNPPGKQNGPSA